VALPFVACTSVVDVVAVPRASGTGTPPSTASSTATGPTTSTTVTSPFCGELVVKSQAGELLRLDASATPVAFGKNTCNLPTPEPVAVRRDGTVWAIAGGKVAVTDVDLGTCRALPVNLAATAMAFVADASGRETLYAIVDGVLVALDPQSYLRTPVAALSVPQVVALAGSADGRLFAFVGATETTLIEIAVGDGSILQKWPIPVEPTAGPLVGGATGEGRTVQLVYGSVVYTLDPFTQTFLQRKSPPVDPSAAFVAAGGPPCASPDPSASVTAPPTASF
jgi:hypothetical protein